MQVFLVKFPKQLIAKGIVSAVVLMSLVVVPVSAETILPTKTHENKGGTTTQQDQAFIVRSQMKQLSRMLGDWRGITAINNKNYDNHKFGHMILDGTWMELNESLSIDGHSVSEIMALITFDTERKAFSGMFLSPGKKVPFELQPSADGQTIAWNNGNVEPAMRGVMKFLTDEVFEEKVERADQHGKFQPFVQFKMTKKKSN